MKIYLAPMEGLADHYLRKLIAAQGGYDLVVTEFIRVTDHLLPKRVFTESVPELNHNCLTPDGTPVRVQLLGNHPTALANNAMRAIELGSHGIDLNFGCPSKTVNSSKGGAVLLKEPETIYTVVNSVRNAVPDTHPVSAKMRLGFDDEVLMWECAHAIREAGATEVIVHARTRRQGYKPPAYWHKVSDFQRTLGIPVIINGEIWTPKDAINAMNEAQCSALMLGRGAVQNPHLARQIKQGMQRESLWQDISPLILQFWTEIRTTMPEKYCAGRLKQWLSYLQNTHTEAQQLFVKIRKSTSIQDISQQLESSI